MISIRNLFKFSSTIQFAKNFTTKPTIFYRLNYGMAFMQLFERTKTPAELDPSFKRITKLKGHLKSKATKKYSKKLNTNVRKQKVSLKNHKGLLKRIKIVIDY